MIGVISFRSIVLFHHQKVKQIWKYKNIFY